MKLYKHLFYRVFKWGQLEPVTLHKSARTAVTMHFSSVDLQRWDCCQFTRYPVSRGRCYFVETRTESSGQMQAILCELLIVDCSLFLIDRYAVADSGFPRGGGTNLLRGRQHTILPNFPNNCMNLKEFGPPGGGARGIRQWYVIHTLGLFL